MTHTINRKRLEEMHQMLQPGRRHYHARKIAIEVLLNCLEEMPIESEKTHNHSEPRTMPDCPKCCESEKKDNRCWAPIMHEPSPRGTMFLPSTCMQEKPCPVHEKKEERCTKCNGTGEMAYEDSMVLGTCYECNGTGIEPRKEEFCNSCWEDVTLPHCCPVKEGKEIAEQKIDKHIRDVAINKTLELEDKLSRYKEALEKIAAPMSESESMDRMLIARTALAEKGEETQEASFTICTCSTYVDGVDPDCPVHYPPAPQERFKPASGEKYWYITDNLNVDGMGSMEDNFDEEMYEVGNCFKSESEALAMAEKTRKLWRGKL